MRFQSLVALAAAVVTCSAPPPPPRMCSTTCLGCCNEYGLCESGLSSSACGANGEACQGCPAGVECWHGGCEVHTDGVDFDCDGRSCPGARADTCGGGSCFCGAEGLCADGSLCSSGHCVCDPQQCPGCCSGGTCVTTFSSAIVMPSTTCGVGGVACVDCTRAGGDGCTNGACTCGTEPACTGDYLCCSGSCLLPSECSFFGPDAGGP
jgi:hypothetical protein